MTYRAMDFHTTGLSIGLLDRALSELKILAFSDLDAADTQTVKHHAEDCIGLGTRVLQILADKGRVEPVPKLSAAQIEEIARECAKHAQGACALAIRAALNALATSKEPTT